MVSRFRVLKKPMEWQVETAISIISAVTVLHNWLIDLNNDVPNGYLPSVIDNTALRREVENSILQDLPHIYKNNNSTRMSMKMRDEFRCYLNNEGAVPWQYDIDGLDY